MRQTIYAHFDAWLCVMLLVARLGDVLSTRLVTPQLKLEGNLVARKLGWPFAAATVLICLVPFYNTALAIACLVPSLLVASSNINRAWAVRAVGEDEYEAILLRFASSSTLSHALGSTLASASFVLLLGAILWVLYPDPQRDWGYWVACGVVGHGLVIALHGSTFTVRLFRRARTGVRGTAQAA